MTQNLEKQLELPGMEEVKVNEPKKKMGIVRKTVTALVLTGVIGGAILGLNYRFVKTGNWTGDVEKDFPFLSKFIGPLPKDYYDNPQKYSSPKQEKKYTNNK